MIQKFSQQKSYIYSHSRELVHTLHPLYRSSLASRCRLCRSLPSALQHRRRTVVNPILLAPSSLKTRRRPLLQRLPRMPAFAMKLDTRPRSFSNTSFCTLICCVAIINSWGDSQRKKTAVPVCVSVSPYSFAPPRRSWPTQRSCDLIS